MKQMEMEHKIGDKVTYKGKKYTIIWIYQDGSCEIINDYFENHLIPEKEQLSSQQ